jgi:hypothetical protein
VSGGCHALKFDSAAGLVLDAQRSSSPRNGHCHWEGWGVCVEGRKGTRSAGVSEPAILPEMLRQFMLQAMQLLWRLPGLVGGCVGICIERARDAGARGGLPLETFLPS